MKVEITVGGFTKKFDTDYHTLHSNDWNDIVRELLDYQQDVDEGPITSEVTGF
jgi:hypothetical protein